MKNPEQPEYKELNYDDQPPADIRDITDRFAYGSQPQSTRSLGGIYERLFEKDGSSKFARLIISTLPSLPSGPIGGQFSYVSNFIRYWNGTKWIKLAGGSQQLFDHYANAGNTTTSETDLYSDTLAAGQLSTNGEKLEAQYGGIFVSSGTATREIRIYFAGTLIFDSGALTLSLSSAWTIYVTIIRVSASVVRCMISMTTEGAALAAYTQYTEVTGLTLANAATLKISGQAAGVGAASNDIVAKLGNVSWSPAA